MPHAKDAGRDPADAMLLELAAAEDLARTLPPASRDRTMLERRIDTLQRQLHLALTADDSSTRGADGSEPAEEGRP